MAAAALAPRRPSLRQARGYDVAVNYKSNSNAAAAVVEAVKKAGGKAVAIQGDMALENDIERVFDTADAIRSDRLPILCTVPELLAKAPGWMKSARRRSVKCSTSILSGRCCVCAPASRRMSTKHGGSGGAVVMLSSMAAPLGGANECVWYAAAKAGVDSMVIGVSREVAKEGIRVNAITPGVIDTDIQPPGRIERVLPMLPMGRPGQAERSRRSDTVPALGRRLLYQWGEPARFRRALIRLALGVRPPIIAARIPSRITSLFKE